MNGLIVRLLNNDNNCFLKQYCKLYMSCTDTRNKLRYGLFVLDNMTPGYSVQLSTTACATCNSRGDTIKKSTVVIK